MTVHTGDPVPCSDPGMDTSCPVQQLASVPCTGDGLNEKEESKLPEQPTEDGSHHHHEWWHHHKAKDDEGGAAVVVKVMADGRGRIEDLQGQIQEEIHESGSLQRMWGTVWHQQLLPCPTAEKTGLWVASCDLCVHVCLSWRTVQKWGHVGSGLWQIFFQPSSTVQIRGD